MWRRKGGAAMLDLNIIPCISSEHKHIWNCHKDCQWCHRSMDDIELEASRLRIKELEDANDRLKNACKKAFDFVDDEFNNKAIVEMDGSFGLHLCLKEALEINE